MNKKNGQGINIYKYIIAIILVVIIAFGSKFTNSDDSSSDANQEMTTTESTDDSADDVGETVADSNETDARYSQAVTYEFRNSDLLESHYEKHGKDMGFSSKEEYQQAASDVVNNPDSLHKTEAEDGDDVYYLEDENYFVVVSTDGYIRTFFEPDSGIKYYNKQ